MNSGIIDISDILDNVERMKNERILAEHPYEIWEASDGRIKTYLSDETKKNGKRLIAKATREKIEKAIIEDWKKNHEERYKIFQLFNDWMTFSKEDDDISPGTIDRYKNDFDKFIRNSDFSMMDIHTITENDVFKFLKSVVTSRKDDKISKKCLRNIKIVINGVFTFAKSERDITCIPIAESLKNFKLSDRLFKHTVRKDSDEVYSDDEIETIAKHIIKIYINRLHTSTRELGILFTLLTGIRVGELVTLKRSDEDSGILYVQRTESKCKGNGGMKYFVKEYPKTVGSMSGVELSDSAIIVWNWIKKINLINGVKSEFIFFEEEFGRLKSYHFVRPLQRICKECGIPFRSIHKLRKTYASILFANNVEEKIVQSQMRHRDIATTHRHYEFSVRNREYKRKQINNADVINVKKIEKDILSNVI